MNDEREQNDGDLELPAELAGQIRELYPPGPSVPDEVDHTIRAAAQAKFARLRRFRSVLRWGSVAAAAAILGFTVRVAWFDSSDSFAREDLNRDGQVDILDAFTLAQHIQAHEKLKAAWDINGDGVVDQKDVDVLAQEAVSLNRGVLR